MEVRTNKPITPLPGKQVQKLFPNRKIKVKLNTPKAKDIMSGRGPIGVGQIPKISYKSHTLKGPQINSYLKKRKS